MWCRDMSGNVHRSVYVASSSWNACRTRLMMYIFTSPTYTISLQTDYSSVSCWQWSEISFGLRRLGVLCYHLSVTNSQSGILVSIRTSWYGIFNIYYKLFVNSLKQSVSRLLAGTVTLWWYRGMANGYAYSSVQRNKQVSKTNTSRTLRTCNKLLFDYRWLHMGF